jgi:hypothetical protein
VRLPYERFLRFLVSRKVDVASALERVGLPPLGGIWLAETRTWLRDTAPYAIVKYLDEDDEDLAFRDEVLDWAEREGIRPLWEMQREFKNSPPAPPLDEAYKVFVNPSARAVLGCLLLSRATEDESRTLMREQFDIDLSPEAFQIYKTIFWDVTLVGRRSWEKFLESLTVVEERSYIAFGLASPTADEVRNMLGMETDVDDGNIVNNIVNRSYQQFKIAMNEPHPEAAGAMRWAELTLKAISVKRGAGGGKGGEGDKTPTTDFKGMFSVQVTKTKHVSLAELSAQSSSVVGMPKDPVKEKEKEQQQQQKKAGKK